MNYKILAVIQARGGSKGIPKKNIYPVAGKPLISYSICAAKNSKYITDLVVSTDSDEIANVAIKYGASVPFKRPAELAGDTITSVESLKYSVLETERIFNKTYDFIIELPCVSPLRDGADIDGAIEKLINTKCDSVISMVCTGEKHPTRLKKIINDNILDISSDYPEPATGSRRQDLKPDAYIRNGAIYAMTRKTLIDNYSRSGIDSRPYIMSPEKSINIDTMFDMEMAEFLIQKGKCNNKPKVNFNLLITTPLHFLPDIIDEYKNIANCIFLNGDSDQLIDNLKNADGWICQPCPKYKINEHILKHAKKIKFVASTSTGTNHIDVDYCNANNIKVLSLRGSEKLSDIVASSEFTFGLMLSTIRNIPKAFNNVLTNNWRNTEDDHRSIELMGKTLGIIGYGRIGSNNAKYALAFGMNVRAHDPYVKITDVGVIQDASAIDVLKNSDVIMICVHLSKETENMVNKNWFNSMKRGVYFINTSRGEIINEEDLISALKSGQVAAAGVDVVSNEANIVAGNTHQLIEYSKGHDNLIITSHIAGLTYDSERKAAKIILEQVEKII